MTFNSQPSTWIGIHLEHQGGETSQGESTHASVGLVGSGSDDRRRSLGLGNGRRRRRERNNLGVRRRGRRRRRRRRSLRVLVVLGDGARAVGDGKSGRLGDRVTFGANCDGGRSLLQSC